MGEQKARLLVTARLSLCEQRYHCPYHYADVMPVCRLSRSGQREMAAVTLFEALAAERPSGDLAAFYVARSAEAARQPPGTPWDGVDDFSEK
jgi:hypothetical protein